MGEQVTEREREAFRTGADFFAVLCTDFSREWKSYQARKKRLAHLLQRGKITQAEYATRIREAAMEYGE